MVGIVRLAAQPGQRRLRLRLAGADRRLVGGQLVFGVVILLGRYRPALHQYGITVERRLIGRHLRLPRHHLALRLQIVGLQRFKVQHGLRQVRLGLVQRDLKPGRVEPEQHLPGLHVLAFMHRDIRHDP